MVRDVTLLNVGVVGTELELVIVGDVTLLLVAVVVGPEPEFVVGVGVVTEPAIALRAIASAVVSQAVLVPCFKRRGRIKQLKSAAQGVKTYAPVTHSAKLPWMQAVSPSV